MKRFSPMLLAALTLASGSVAAHVQAQSFSANVELFIDGKERANEPQVFITATQCGDQEANDGGSKFRFRISGYTGTINNMEVWATGSDTDCSTSAARAFNSTQARSCWLIGELTGVTERVDFTINGEQIFRAGGGSQADGRTTTPSCPASRGNKFTVYFVPLSSPTSSNTSMPPAPLTNVGPQNPRATLTLYTDLPNAPTDVKGDTGEVRLALSWDKASGAEARTTYRAYFDTQVGENCDGTDLVKDQTAADLMLRDRTDIVARSAGKGLAASLRDLDEEGVAIGGYVAAAVVSIDVAKNESPLSDVVCIQRVNTRSFADECEMDPDCRNGFDACSTRAPGSRSAGMLGLAVLFGFGVALRARRRRHG